MLFELKFEDWVKVTRLRSAMPVAEMQPGAVALTRDLDTMYCFL